MKFKFFLIFFAALVISPSLNGQDKKTRPRELQFYMNSILCEKTIIEYNNNGFVLKMSSFSHDRLTDYSRYSYDKENRLLNEKTYDRAGVLIKIRKYYYNEAGLIAGERVFSWPDKLIEYNVINYTDNKIDIVYYYNKDNLLIETIEFMYKNGFVNIIKLNKIGKYIMIMNPVYDDKMKLIGHRVEHSGADVKIETKYIYEDGYAADEAIRLIFR